jgi:glutathione peroxidase
MSTALYDIPVKKIDGTPTTLKTYKDKVLLIVNVASECGLTPQYDGLEKLYERYRAQGLEVLGFPANEFGAQEPGTNQEIQQFCKTKFGVQFPMFEKIVVKGNGQHPLYKHLVNAVHRPVLPPGSKMAARLPKGDGPVDIQWNFEKFLVDRGGKVVGRYSPDMTPEDPTLVKAVEQQLG